MARAGPILRRALVLADLSITFGVMAAYLSGHLAYWVGALVLVPLNLLYAGIYWFGARRLAGLEPRLPASPDDLVFIGGGRWPRPWGRRFRWQGANATWPLVELRIGEGHVLVRLRWKLVRGVLSPILRDVGLPISEVTVDPIQPLFGEGVRLTTEKVGVIFWTFERQEVLDALVARGAHLGEPDRVW